MYNFALVFALNILALVVVYKSLSNQNLRFLLVCCNVLIWTAYSTAFCIGIILSGSAMSREVSGYFLIRFYRSHSTNHRPFEGQRMAVLIHKAMNRCDNDEVKQIASSILFIPKQSKSHSEMYHIQLMQFSVQLLHRMPVASCGLFTFDWTLLYTVSIYRMFCHSEFD